MQEATALYQMFSALAFAFNSPTSPSLADRNDNCPLESLSVILIIVIDTARIVCDRVYATVRCPSVCPIYRPLYTAVAGLLLWARRAGDID